MHDTVTIAIDDDSEEVVELSEMLADDSQIPVAEQVERAELAALATSAAEQLTEPQRTALHLRIDEGKPYREIASAMETTVGTAKSRVHYALARLRGLLAAAHE